MKFGIKCKVDSTSEIGKEPVPVTLGGKEITLVPSDEGFLTELDIIVRIINDEAFISQVTPPKESEKAPGAVTIDFDRRVFDNLIEMAQYLEGLLSLLYGVNKIYWDEPEVVFLPESEEESEKYHVTRAKLSHFYPKQNTTLTLGTFKDIIQQKSKFEPFTVIHLFHRDGMLEYGSFRYIQAFYNFYFVLEDLYAQGKTNNHEVEKRFKANSVLRRIIQEVLDTRIRVHANHLLNIQNFLKEENKVFDVDGLIELIVQVRGNLHHYSGRSTKRKGTPLNQKDFESMAFLLMAISMNSIIEAMFK